MFRVLRQGRYSDRNASTSDDGTSRVATRSIVDKVSFYTVRHEKCLMPGYTGAIIRPI